MAAAAPPSPVHLRGALRVLRRGGIVAYPTEAVWGLGCEPTDEAAVRRLLALKRRSVSRGLIVIASHFDDVEHWLLPLSEKIEQRALRTWPGAVTWLWPATPEVPRWITGDSDRVAVRITRHPVAAALCDAYGGPLVSTSANRSGQEPAMSATEVRLRLGQGVDAILPGATGRSLRPTTIRDLLSGRTVRY